jgi:hypothetical protein
MPTLEADSVNLTIFSPPYGPARSYDIGFSLDDEEFVAWMVKVMTECRRVCKGLTAAVIGGRTRHFRWSAYYERIAADLFRNGFNLRPPPTFHRCGIPGSGGPDWWRNDWEPILCVTRPGKLPWSDNTACGKPPKYDPGGEMSYRLQNGRRKNKTGPRGYQEGDVATGTYAPPALANPGNVIKVAVGGGRMGSKFAHENEAPFPEQLVEPFILSFCPPGGVVLDPMMGSGTSIAVAHRLGRHGIGIDIRENQVELARRRLEAEGADTEIEPV